MVYLAIGTSEISIYHMYIFFLLMVNIKGIMKIFYMNHFEQLINKLSYYNITNYKDINTFFIKVLLMLH